MLYHPVQHSCLGNRVLATDEGAADRGTHYISPAFACMWRPRGLLHGLCDDRQYLPVSDIESRKYPVVFNCVEKLGEAVGEGGVVEYVVAEE